MCDCVCNMRIIKANRKTTLGNVSGLMMFLFGLWKWIHLENWCEVSSTSDLVLISVWFLYGVFCFCFLSFFQQIFLSDLKKFVFSEDKRAIQYSIWSRHRGLSVDCWLPLAEGPQQPLGVQQWAGPRKWHGAAARHFGGEKGEVSWRVTSVESFQVVNGYTVLRFR